MGRVDAEEAFISHKICVEQFCNFNEKEILLRETATKEKQSCSLKIEDEKWKKRGNL